MPEVGINDISPISGNQSEQSTPNDCNEDDIDPSKVEEANVSDTGESKQADEEEEEEWTDILGSGQVKMKVLRKGEPDTRPQPTDLCHINLVGRLDDGKIVEEARSQKIQLGDYEVIQGLELALSLMNVGEETLVIVAPRFAYGSIGCSTKNIPPEATITYTVELLKVETEPDLEDIPYEKRKVIASAKRERGNWWYSRQDGTKAVVCYRKALDILNETVPYVDENNKTVENTEDLIKSIIEEKLKVYNNLAAAQLMLEAYNSALLSVNVVIKHDPKNVKALFRKSKILTAKHCITEAVEVLSEAYALEPQNTAVRTELEKCKRLQIIEKRREKMLYKKMMEQHSSSEKTVEKTKKKSSFWAKVVGTAATATLMAAVAVAISYKFKTYPFL